VEELKLQKIGFGFHPNPIQINIKGIAIFFILSLVSVVGDVDMCEYLDSKHKKYLSKAFFPLTLLEISICKKSNANVVIQH
jgi:hypothetical protein